MLYSPRQAPSKSRILSATVYMADASLKDEMNEAWMAWVDRSNLPARAAVGAVLTPGTLVEIMVCSGEVTGSACSSRFKSSKFKFRN